MSMRSKFITYENGHERRCHLAISSAITLVCGLAFGWAAVVPGAVLVSAMVILLPSRSTMQALTETSDAAQGES